MIEAIDSPRNCPVCGCAIEATAVICAACGTEFKAETEPSTPVLADVDLALQTVDPEHRVEVAHFEIDHGEEAELACGMLRANGIACMLSSPVLPGLPAEQKLWVNSADAEQALKLLADAEGRATTEDTEGSDAA
jgi:hypothetical protein